MDKWILCYLVFGYSKSKFIIENRTPGFGTDIDRRWGLRKIGTGKVLMVLGLGWNEWFSAVFFVARWMGRWEWLVLLLLLLRDVFVSGAPYTRTHFIFV